MDKRPRVIHALEQFGGALNEMADVLVAYYKRLAAHGVDVVTVREMVLEVQGRLLSGEQVDLDDDGL